MGTTDKRKQSLYFPEAMLREIAHEAQRLDRSMSWLVQRAWKIAHAKIRAEPSDTDVVDDATDDVRGREE